MVLLRCSKIQNLKDLILAHPDTKKKVDVFALSVYGLVVFPKALGHVDETVTDLFDRLDKRVTPVPKVDKVSYWVFSENYSPLKEIVAILRRDDISEEKWIAILQNLQEEDIEWRAPWIPPDYKKLRFSIRTTGLGKTLKQWSQEIQEERIKADRWERKFQEAQMRNETLEKGLSESRNEKGELKARVAELEKILH
ncbi:hypothetical protein Goklo_029700 [Gossypium klotzschianum]|uniref:Uncharacterized protein n=1 Tax=Gossypium klotzschianum TaxID=34286 RepID=A0A7J8WAG6_9ROSI|nr:hypothetical protein [Gossypium klotzschianum]